MAAKLAIFTHCQTPTKKRNRSRCLRITTTKDSPADPAGRQTLPAGNKPLQNKSGGLESIHLERRLRGLLSLDSEKLLLVQPVAGQPEPRVVRKIEVDGGVAGLNDGPRRPPEMGRQRPSVNFCAQRLHENLLVCNKRGWCRRVPFPCIGLCLCVGFRSGHGSQVGRQECGLCLWCRVGFGEVRVEPSMLRKTKSDTGCGAAVPGGRRLGANHGVDWRC